MALPSSGTISILDLVAEFGGSSPHSLTEYYRGAGLVPDTATNAGVPTSGAISLSDFYNAANLTAEFDRASYSASHSVVTPNSASCTLSVTNGGAITASPTGLGGSYENQGELTEADFDIRLDLTSGSTPTGSSLGAWLNLATSRSWTLSRSGLGTSTFTGTLSIRNTGSGSAIDTASVTMTASVTSDV